MREKKQNMGVAPRIFDRPSEMPRRGTRHASSTKDAARTARKSQDGIQGFQIALIEVLVDQTVLQLEMCAFAANMHRIAVSIPIMCERSSKKDI